jgi:hypothetical protein
MLSQQGRVVNLPNHLASAAGTATLQWTGPFRKTFLCEFPVLITGGLTTVEYKAAISNLEAVEQWGKAHGGTASDIRRRCPELRRVTLGEITAMCERLVAEGRLTATNVPVPSRRYVGRSLAKSAEYTEHSS